VNYSLPKKGVGLAEIGGENGEKGKKTGKTAEKTGDALSFRLSLLDLR